MFRTKLKTIIYMTAFTSCLIFASGCSQKSNEPVKQVEEMLNLDALSGDNSAVEEVYQTVEVTVGDISETAAAMGSVSFPIKHDLTHGYEQGNVIYKSSPIAAMGTVYVEEGEIVAILELYVEPFAKEEARIKYEKALHSYENNLEKKNEDIKDLLEDIENETNTYEKQILELDYEVALSSYDEYVEEQTQYLDELKASYELYTQESGEIYIYAPCDGILSRGKLTVGDIVDADTTIATVYSLEKVMVTIDSRSASQFNFGNNVEIKISSVTPEITLQGQVISAPNILHNADSVSTTVAITSAFPEVSTLSNSARNRLSVITANDYVKDGIIIPSSALSEAKGSTGVVYVLENGSLIKKNVKYGYKGSDYAWILEGLEPGQQVTTK